MSKKRYQKTQIPIASYLAIGIVFCCLLKPVQNPIKNLLHNVAYLLESPNAIIDHNTKNTIPKAHTHFKMQLPKSHEVIDIIDHLFGAKNNIPVKHDLKKTVLDKHFICQKTAYKGLFLWQPQNILKQLCPKIKNGFPNLFKEPPRL